MHALTVPWAPGNGADPEVGIYHSMHRARHRVRSGEISRVVMLTCAQASAEISHVCGASTTIADISARSCSRARASAHIFTRTTSDPPSKLHRRVETAKVRRTNRITAQLKGEAAALYKSAIPTEPLKGSLHARRPDWVGGRDECIWICGGRSGQLQ